MPGFPCCCDTGVECDPCTDGVPTTLSVALSGAADDGCTDYTLLDGSYTVDFTTCTTWGGDFTTPLVELDVTGCTTGYDSLTYSITVTVVMTKTGPLNKINVYFSIQGDLASITYWETHSFEKSLVLPTDCCAWTTFGIPYNTRVKNTTNFGGDLSGATCTITSGTGGGC